MSEDITKLPKWARELIADLQRQRKAAIDQLNEFCDHQKFSPFFVEEFVCTGEGRGPELKRTYIQASSVDVEWRGVRLKVSANDYGNSGDGINLQWALKNCVVGEVALIPESFQKVRLVAKEDMR